MKRAGIFLVAVALVVGMVGCVVVKYDLNIASTAGGSVTTPGEEIFTYDEGEVVNLVATPDAGYHFVEWTGDVSDVADVEDATTTITMNDDYSITANFIKQYDLTISSTTGGSITTPSEGTYTYDEGTVVNLVAEADEGYRFENWTGDVDTIADINAATTIITMQGDYIITANFVIPPVQYNLTISSSPSGSVTVPGEGTFVYDEGTVVSLVAEPKESCWFDKWTGDVDDIDNIEDATTTITMNKDYTIRADFFSPICGCG